MKKYPLILVVLLIVTANLFVSCAGKGNDVVDESKGPIVTVLGQTLYKSDLEGIVHYGMTVEDSTAAVQSFIKSWINETLIYGLAKENREETSEIDRLVEEYRKSLIINNYLNSLLQERVSEIVSDEELLEFFNANKERFNLKGNIIKGLFLKMPKESSQVKNYKKWYKQETDEAIDNMEKNKLQNVIAYENFYSNWVNFSDVIDNIPEKITDETAFLKTNKTHEVQDSSFVYLLNIKEYKLEGTEPPFEYIKDYLRKVFLEEKRADYIKKLQADLYNMALTEDNIRYYVR